MSLRTLVGRSFLLLASFTNEHVAGDDDAQGSVKRKRAPASKAPAKKKRGMLDGFLKSA